MYIYIEREREKSFFYNTGFLPLPVLYSVACCPPRCLLQLPITYCSEKFVLGGRGGGEGDGEEGGWEVVV